MIIGKGHSFVEPQRKEEVRDSYTREGFCLFVIETASAQGMPTSSRCYTLEELVHGGKNKDHKKRSIS